MFLLFESDHRLSDLDNDDYSKLNSHFNNAMLWFFVGKSRQKLHSWSVMLWNRGLCPYYTTQIYWTSNV